MALRIEAEARVPAEGRRLIRLELNALEPGLFQPRKVFDEAGIQELAESIRRHGLLQPLVVRRNACGGYELIAGERRLRALKRLGHTYAEAVLTPAFDLEAALIALAENLEREQLHFFEEAEAYRRLVREHNLTQEELARRLGRSVSAISNKMRLAQLEPTVRDKLVAAGLSERHARELLRLRGEEERLSALSQAIARRMSVRSLETLVDRLLTKERTPRIPPLRDSRPYVNAVLHTVRKLNAAGVHASSRVVEREEAIDVIVTLPRADQYSSGALQSGQRL